MTPAERAGDYLRQASHPLAEHARAALAAGALALAYAQVRALRRVPMGGARDACADFALREIQRIWIPELPSRADARFKAWADSRGYDPNVIPPAPNSRIGQ